MTKFDLRETCFHTGRKLSPPRSEWKVCDCCGQAIVKGYKSRHGEYFGADCRDIMSRFLSSYQSADDFAARYKRATGLTLKPAVLRYLRAL